MSEIRAMNIRLPKDIWVFTKKKSVDREMSMNQIIIDLLKKYKKSCENKLTDKNNMVP